MKWSCNNSIQFHAVAEVLRRLDFLSVSLSTMSASEVSRKSEPSVETARRKRNYKLIVDPELRKEAAKKVYRFDGCVPGVRLLRSNSCYSGTKEWGWVRFTQASKLVSLCILCF